MRNSYNDCKDEIHSGHVGIYIYLTVLNYKLLHVLKIDGFIMIYFILPVQNSTLIVL